MDPNATALTLDWASSRKEKFKDLPPQSTLDNGQTRAAPRKSLRERPSHLLEKQDRNAVPLSSKNVPLRTPQLKSQSPKMSLFNLFSRPKVEKARGYAEQGLAVPTSLIEPQASNITKPEPSNPHLSVDAGRNALQPRTPSVMSFRTAPAKTASKAKAESNPAPNPAKERKGGQWEAPPLFLANTQSRKTGLVEVSNMAAGMVLPKPRYRKAGGLQLPAEPTLRDSSTDRLSTETRRTGRATAKHVSGASFTIMDIPRKIFVLANSGCLLQYAEEGPSDRLPEKVLQLGQDSAAFASDLIPGKHYVLQVLQAVSSQGIVAAHSTSIFSKLGMRSVSAKRTATSLLLVLPSAVEMDAWMTAIRAEIDELGGKKSRTDTVKEGAVTLSELQLTPAATHRSQGNANQSLKTLSPRDPVHSTMPQEEVLKEEEEEEDEDAEPATIDGIEQEEAHLPDPPPAMPPNSHRASDEQSSGSYTAVSLDQHRLDSIRSSQRTSHSSTTRTVATTLESNSRTNSLTGSPPTDGHLKDPQPNQAESVSIKSPYRTLASYGIGARRKSVKPVRDLMPRPDLPQQIERITTLAAAEVESPVVGLSPSLSSPSASPQKLVLASSESKSRASEDSKTKHDSKFSSPPLTSGDDSRPESFIGDLPPPSTWTNSSIRSPSKRASLLVPTKVPPIPQHGVHRVSSQAAPRTSEPYRPQRQLSQPFSLPLRINPSTPGNRPPSRHGRNSLAANEDEVSEKPVVHTLTAKIDGDKRLWISPISPALHPASSERSEKPPARTPSGRLSLFPTSPTAIPSAEALKLSPTKLAQSVRQAQPNSRSLRRPTSMQVRSDRAPFLSSVRSPATAPLPTGQQQQQQRAVTAPIRSLKPSRSASNILSSSGQLSPTDPFSRSTSRRESQFIAEEASDQPTPLPRQLSSPPSSRPVSRTGGRRVRTRSSLPELDLGIPVVGLGPPAPPPKAPLPLPPPASRPTSPPPVATGLGIRV